MTQYCLDTSAFIQPWRALYPIDVFPSYWDKIEEWIDKGRIISPDEVLVEIKKIDDDLLSWVSDRKASFQPPDEPIQERVRSILASHARLVDTKKGRSIADPWVIAQAQETASIVVTEEQHARGRSPKIPDVCEDLQVPYMNVLGLIRDMGLSF